MQSNESAVAWTRSQLIAGPVKDLYSRAERAHFSLSAVEVAVASLGARRTDAGWSLPGQAEAPRSVPAATAEHVSEASNGGMNSGLNAEAVYARRGEEARAAASTRNSGAAAASAGAGDVYAARRAQVERARAEQAAAHGTMPGRPAARPAPIPADVYRSRQTSVSDARRRNL